MGMDMRWYELAIKISSITPIIIILSVIISIFRPKYGKIIAGFLIGILLMSSLSMMYVKRGRQSNQQSNKPTKPDIFIPF